MQNSVVVFILLTLDWKFPFWANLVKKTQKGQFKLIRYLDKFKYVEFSGAVSFFRFWLEIPFLGKFGPKNQNCQFKLKFGT